MTDLAFLIGTADRPAHLRALLSSLVVQTNPRWHAVVLDEGYDPNVGTSSSAYAVVCDIADPRIEWLGCGPSKRDWHQTVRADVAPTVDARHLCFTADDSYYAPRFVEWMVAACDAERWALAYCDWVYDQAGYVVWHGVPIKGRIDVGGFIVRKDAFDAVGWPWRHHEGDGEFVEAVARAGFAHGRVAHVLYVKN